MVGVGRYRQRNVVENKGIRAQKCRHIALVFVRDVAKAYEIRYKNKKDLQFCKSLCRD